MRSAISCINNPILQITINHLIFAVLGWNIDDQCSSQEAFCRKQVLRWEVNNNDRVVTVLNRLECSDEHLLRIVMTIVAIIHNRLTVKHTEFQVTPDSNSDRSATIINVRIAGKS